MSPQPRIFCLRRNCRKIQDRWHGPRVATVTKEDNRLFGQMPGQTKLELLPASETQFGLREVNAQITFVKDANGKITKAKLLQAGQTTEPTKLN